MADVINFPDFPIGITSHAIMKRELLFYSAKIALNNAFASHRETFLLKVMAYVNGVTHPLCPFPIRVYDASEIIVGEIAPQSTINDTVEFTGEFFVL